MLASRLVQVAWDRSPSRGGNVERWTGLPGWATAVVLLAYVLLLLLRFPELLYPGRFWAEEGSIYFAEAATQSWWTVLTTPQLGYYSLFNKLACLIAAHSVPLRLAPVVTAMFAAAAQLLPAILLLRCRVSCLPRPWQRVVAVALVMLTQPNHEVWLNTANSQFFLCLSAAIVLVSEARTRAGHVARLTVLALAGLTGVTACLLMPLFLIVALTERTGPRRHELAVLVICCIIQTVTALTSVGRPVGAAVWIVPYIIAIKQGVLPLLGVRVADDLGFWLFTQDRYLLRWLSPLPLVPYAIVALLMWRWGRRQAQLLYLAAIAMAVISALMSTDAQSESALMRQLLGEWSGRYYFAPNAMIALAMLMIVTPDAQARRSDRRFWRWFAAAWVILTLFSGVRDYLTTRAEGHWAFSGPSWPREVNRRELGADDRLQIWPQGWVMVLPREP